MLHCFSPWKHQKTFRFSFFTGYSNATLGWNRLTHFVLFPGILQDFLQIIGKILSYHVLFLYLKEQQFTEGYQPPSLLNLPHFDITPLFWWIISTPSFSQTYRSQEKSLHCKLEFKQGTFFELVSSYTRETITNLSITVFNPFQHSVAFHIKD